MGNTCLLADEALCNARKATIMVQMYLLSLDVSL